MGVMPPGVQGLSTMVCNNENDVAIVGGGFGALKPQGSRTIAPWKTKNVL
jgi:hypothetical protein